MTRWLLGCLLMHELGAQLIPWAWWVPDFTLVGLILAVGQSPDRWWLFSGLAGLTTYAWAVRVPGPILISFLALGWVAHLVAKQWDATDPRVQYLVVGIASALMAIEALWLEDLWSPPLVGLAGARVLLTCLMVPLARQLLFKTGTVR